MADSRTVTVNVTPAMIATGIQFSCEDCAVALGIKAAVPGCEDVKVDDDYIHFTLDGERWKAITPQEVEFFIVDLDHDQPVSPFQFTAVFERA